MKNKPLVSVVITTMPGREELLLRLLESIHRQTYNNIETIIKCGGDNVQRARNEGVSLATGKYIALADDDDEFHPEKIARQVEYMEDHPSCALCLCWGTDYKFGEKVLLAPQEHHTFEHLVSGFHISCTSAFLVRAKKFWLVGGMDESLVDSHEYDLAIRLSQVGTVYCVQENLVTFYETGSNWSSSFPKKIRGMFQFIAKYRRYFKLRRWVCTIGCLGLFGLGFCLGKYGAWIHKIFIVVKKFEINKESSMD
ncbi:MAG: glycosyltransferase [Perlabentimonas sp.]